MKKFIVLILTVIMTVFISSCGTNDDSGGLKADHWYHYKELDIVNVQNCVVQDSYVKVAGDVSVTYYPLCKHCKEHGNLSWVVVDSDNPVVKTYFCECDKETTVKIKIIL